MPLPYDPMTPAIKIQKQSDSPMQTVKPTSSKPLPSQSSMPEWKKNNYSYPEDRITKSPPGNILQKRKPLINRNA